MARRILLGGLIGGVVMFVWSAVAHMALPLGEAGIRSLPDGLLAPMHAAMSQPGMYIFPGMEPEGGMAPGQIEAARARWLEKHKSGPAGILVYRPKGGELNFPLLLAVELVSNLLVCLLAAWLVAQAPPPGFVRRVLFVAALGLVSFLAIEASYWNWYGFPASYTLAQLVDHVVGFALAGLPIAAFVKRAI